MIRSRHRLALRARSRRSLDGHARGRAASCQARSSTLRDLARGLRGAGAAPPGALDLDVPEAKAWVDEHGVPSAIERRPHLESHELIEEFMLLANRCVGEEGARRERRACSTASTSRRSPRKLAELDAMLKALGLPRLGPISRAGARRCRRCSRVPLDPPQRRLLHRMVLRSLARARYLERDVGHFGLATREYCHFTSPIRRYPDLHNHARVREWIRGSRDAAWDPVELAGARQPLQRPRSRTPPTPSARRCASRDCVFSRGDLGSTLRVSSPA